MSGLDQLIRLQRWTLDEKRRQATDLELLIERLIQDITKLDARGRARDRGLARRPSSCSARCPAIARR